MHRPRLGRTALRRQPAGVASPARGHEDPLVDPRAQPMFELYRRGVSLRQVGKHFGVSGTTVKNVLLGAGFPVRSYEEAMRTVPTEEVALPQRLADSSACQPGRPGDTAPRSKSPSEDSRVPAMYQAYLEGATLEQAGRQFGLTRERVRQLFKGAGLPTRSVAAAHRLRSAQRTQPGPADGVTDKQLARVRKVAEAIALFRASGLLDESAARAGISVATLRRWLIRLNQPLPPTPREKVLLRQLADHLSKHEIAAASARTRGEIVTELERLFAKLRVANRADAIRVARDLGWLSRP